MQMILDKAYWDNRYLNENTGWDAGAVTTPIKEYIDSLQNTAAKILLPGAGNGYEFEYLINHGFDNSYVLDIAPTPLNNIKARLPEVDNEHLIQEDFFAHTGRYDLILEQTFFCALSPSLRKKYADKMYSLLKPGGKLAGLLFNFPLTEVGPPFGGCIEEYRTFFSPIFTIHTLEPAYNSIKPRDGKELFFIFEKK